MPHGIYFRATHRGHSIQNPPSSNIGYNVHYEEMKAANRWGLSPSQWYVEPRWARAVMVAWCQVHDTIDYWMVEDAVKK